MRGVTLSRSGAERQAGLRGALEAVRQAALALTRIHSVVKIRNADAPALRPLLAGDVRQGGSVLLAIIPAGVALPRVAAKITATRGAPSPRW